MKRINFTDKAREKFKDSLFEKEKQIYSDHKNTSETYMSYMSKYPSLLSVMCMFIHFTKGYKDETRICLSTVEEAIELADFFVNSAKAIYVGNSLSSAKTTEKIYKAIQEKRIQSGMTIRDFVRLKIGGIRNADEAMEALQPFIEDGAVLVRTEQNYNGGRPSKKISINTLLTWDL